MHPSPGTLVRAHSCRNIPITFFDFRDRGFERNA
jgi:hypothetical protein